MSRKHWLVEAFEAGRLDKIVEQSNREYDEGRALDSLEPSPEPKEDQSQCLLAPSHGSAAPCETHYWPGAAHGEQDKCPKCGWTCQYYGDGFGGINHGVWVATKPPNAEVSEPGARPAANATGAIPPGSLH